MNLLRPYSASVVRESRLVRFRRALHSLFTGLAIRLPRPPGRGTLAVLLGGGLVLVSLELLGIWVASLPPEETAPATPPKGRNAQGGIDTLRRRVAALAPEGTYVVVDTALNRVYLRQGDRTVREMLASCGSGNVLEDPAGDRKWVFDTPRGEFRVQSKIADPVWMKPDWAYIEEGEPIPSDHRERAQPGMLGDYAVGIGRGYFIHGTLYSRLLGRNVSHGCIRLGDEDLKAFVGATSIGTRVIIY